MSSERPGFALQFWSLALPVLKCAVCPACLSLFGGLFAGARLGLVGDERFNGTIVALAVIANLFVLRAAMRHHGSPWPLRLCVAGGAVATFGHFTAEGVEFTGFALLMLAAVANLILLRRHRQEGGSCCANERCGQRVERSVALKRA